MQKTPLQSFGDQFRGPAEGSAAEQRCASPARGHRWRGSQTEHCEAGPDMGWTWQCSRLAHWLGSPATPK
eukprot:7813359-Alexandrium_andersonii.AAC.1